MKNGSVMSILRVLTKRGGDAEKPGGVSFEIPKGFFVEFNELVVKLSTCATGHHFSLPCEAIFHGLLAGIVQPFGPVVFEGDLKRTLVSPTRRDDRVTSL